MRKERKLFYEYGPICYKISLFKEARLKDLRDLKNGKKFAIRFSDIDKYDIM